MSTTLARVQGDVDDTATIAVGGMDDLSTVASVEAHVWMGAATPATLTASVVAPEGLNVLVSFGDETGWLATVTSTGQYNMELEFTFDDGSVKSWPDERPLKLLIRPQGG